jgi:hypothetical protein
VGLDLWIQRGPYGMRAHYWDMVPWLTYNFDQSSEPAPSATRMWLAQLELPEARLNAGRLANLSYRDDPAAVGIEWIAPEIQIPCNDSTEIYSHFDWIGANIQSKWLFNILKTDHQNIFYVMCAQFANPRDAVLYKLTFG